MARLSDTVAGLVARGRASASMPAASGRELRPALAFGSNPGALRMWLHLPDPLPPNAPLVVVLHGCGQSAAGYAAGAGWLELADRYGFVVLCPEQARTNNANLCFNWFEGADVERGSGEVASIAQMIRWSVTHHGLDPKRIFITGLSAGGAMAAAMLATYPEMFAAGAVIAGLPYGVASGVAQALGAMRRIPDHSAKAWGDKVRAAAPSPAAWPRIAIWHGDADMTVTPAAAEALVLQWRDVHGATRLAAKPSADAFHSKNAWLGPDGGVAVELHRIVGLGHGTPIAATGVDACGSPAPWILEVGVSSSLEIARSWGLTSGGYAAVGAKPPPRELSPVGPTQPGRAASLPKMEVGETITRALRQAGLMR